MAGAGLPVVLDVTGRTVLVGGGGPVGRRKAAAARAAGANVRVVAPEPPHPDLAADPAVEWLAEPYHAGHLGGVRLAFAAAPAAVNERVVTDAAAAGVWVNSATGPPAGDFALPAAVRRGAFVLAVGTGGAAPAFARRVRDRLAAEFGAAVGEFVALLAEVRPAVLAAVGDPAARRELLDRLSGWDWLDRLRRDGVEATRAAMAEEIRRAAT